MEPERVRAYLQAACAGLGFDVGEVWWTDSETGSSTLAAIEEPDDGDDYQLSSCKQKKLRFVQLYTSKAFESHRSELLNPPSEEEEDTKPGFRHMDSTEMISQHVLSPSLVEAISNTAQVVWANTRRQEGLTGRSDVRLQTAVGMPVAVDSNGNMCVVVMFSPNNIQSTDNALEFLQSISRGATASSIPCLMPALNSETTGMKPISSALREGDFVSEALAPSMSTLRLGDDVSARFMSLPDDGTGQMTSAAPEVHSSHDVSSAPKDTFGIPMLPSFAELGNAMPDDSNEIFDEASYGIWSTIMGSTLDESQPPLDAAQELTMNGSSSALLAAPVPADGLKEEYGNQDDPYEPNSVIDPQLGSTDLVSSYPVGGLGEKRRQRLLEFCEAFLGMSVFDIADVWVPAGKSEPEALKMGMSVSTTKSSQALNQFREMSQKSTIKLWNGAVGRAFSSGNPVWTANPGVFMDLERAQAFQAAHIQTVLAVPVFSGRQPLPTCVVACYSLVRSGSVPFVLRFVQQALRLLWDGLDGVQPHESVGPTIWSDVAPADLGEMAADVEMQHHFMSKKRPYLQISHIEQPSRVSEVPLSQSANELETSTQMESVRMPDGKVITVPLQLDSVSASTVPKIEDVQGHLVDALKSVGNAVPFEHAMGNPRGAKRAHTMGPITGQGHSPLSFPRQIIGAPRSSSVSTTSSATSSAGRWDRSDGSIPTNSAFPTAATTTFVAETVQKNERRNHQRIAPAIQAGAPHPLTDAPSMNFASTQAPTPSFPVQGEMSWNDPAQFCMPVSQPQTAVAASSLVGKKLCRIQGCDEPAVSRRPYCVRHSGNRTCEREGCTKCAQGSTRFCIAHGGGRRCTFPGCDKGARDKNFCAAHGGGKRCRMDGCSKSAVGGSNLCTAHGGGRRCAVDGCDKSAQSSTKFCVKHGGGKKCAHEGCVKVARGRTKFCASHGGGVRCKLQGCNRVAIGKMQLCRAHGGGSNTRQADTSFVPPSTIDPRPSEGVLGNAPGFSVDFMSV